MSNMNRAIFFDRDGVLNRLINRDDGWYSPRKLANFKIIPNSIEATRQTSSLGYLNIVVSNQPDIARCHLKETELKKMTKKLLDKLPLDDVFYCIHDDSDLCECRKPAPGLFFQAAEKWNIDLDNSYMIGDTWKDIEAARSANITSLLLSKDYNLDYDSPFRLKELEDMFSYIA